MIKHLNRRQLLAATTAPAAGMAFGAFGTMGAAARAQAPAVPPASAASAATTPPAAPAAPAVGRARSRSDLLAALPALRSAAEAPGAGAAARHALARLLFELGEWHAALALALSLADAAPGDADAVERAARLLALLGQPDAAIARWEALIARPELPAGLRVRAQVALMFLYYRRDRFDAIAALQLPPQVVLPLLDQARAFGSRPYQAHWDGSVPHRHAAIPMLELDPLPLLPVLVEGQEILVLLDTGADQLILDTELADRIGVRRLGAAAGQFAGGQSASVGFGRIGELRLGPLALREVPVQILPTRRFGSDPQRPIQGVLGTSVLRQVLASVDHARRALVIRERSAAARAALEREMPPAAVLPFGFDATHLLFVRGALNDSPPLTLFFDTGLAAAQAVVAPEQTLRLLGLPVPSLQGAASGTGGGGAVPMAPFPLRRIALGPLEQVGLDGLYGPLPAASYWARGFIQDALLSHRFVRRYGGWSLDFDAQELLIHR